MARHRILQAVFVEAAAQDATRLPPELEQRAVERLRIAVVVLSLLFAFAIPMRWLAWREEDLSLFLVSTIVASIFVALGTATSIALRWPGIQPPQALMIGLAFEICFCFAVAVVEQVLVGLSPMPFRLSLVALALIAFPLIVPSPPRWRLFTTLACALVQPLALFVLALFAEGRLDLHAIVSASAPTLIVAAIAAWLANVVHRLRMDAGQALAFGQYELTTKLGEGGMGEVWRARHQKLLRPAALKIIRPESMGLRADMARARFHREAQATAALTSPHTVSLYDYGTADDGTLYYAMELLDGIDLETLVARHGPLPEARVLSILAQAALSLAEAHARGLVHRDIKPANLVLCRVGTEVDYVKVLDFGLVKPVQLDGMGDVSIPGGVSGTPGYVAPEVASGGAYDGRADLYSLGCVAYFLLTGQRVFLGKSRMELLTLAVKQDALPPRDRIPGLQISDATEQLVMDLLARGSERRIESALVLRERALAILTTQPPFDAPAWWAMHMKRADATA
ncbi:MAG: serine/threonine-protein kinase [Sandaracinaceae bacterium]